MNLKGLGLKSRVADAGFPCLGFVGVSVLGQHLTCDRKLTDLCLGFRF